MNPADYLDPARLLRMALMVVLSLIAIFAEAAPLGLGPNAPPSPDLLMCVLIYWSIRRPGSTPLVAVFALGLVRDFLTDVPVGAGTLTLLIVTETFKSQRRALARLSFAVEWLAVGAASLGTAAVLWMLVIMTLAQPPYLVDLLHQCLYTTMIYPVLMLLFRWVLRINWRRLEPV